MDLRQVDAQIEDFLNKTEKKLDTHAVNFITRSHSILLQLKYYTPPRSQINIPPGTEHTEFIYRSG